MDLTITFAIFLALLFSFIIGMNDAGNAIASVIATRALSPFHSLVMAALGNIAGPFLLTTAIAKTIGTGIIAPSAFNSQMILIALIIAVLLLALFTKYGFPISASHALIGTLIGTAIAGSGFTSIIWPTFQMLQAVFLAGMIGTVCGALYLGLIAWILNESIKIGIIGGAIAGFSLMIAALMLFDILQISSILAIVLFIVISPTIGFIGAFTFDIIISYLFRFTHQKTRNQIFLPLQIGAGFLQAAGHGANDGLLAVGVIGLLLYTGGITDSFSTPIIVIAASACAIGIGTFFGGWKVIIKMAKKITRIRPYQGFCSSIAGGTMVSLMAYSGIPSSSTHIISGSIIGVGATRGKNAVDWRIVRDIASAWIFTMPVSIVVSIVFYLIIHSLIILLGMD